MYNDCQNGQQGLLGSCMTVSCYEVHLNDELDYEESGARSPRLAGIRGPFIGFALT